MSGFQDIQIRPIIVQHGLANFIETGCHTGDGLVWARHNGLLNLYSCDIMQNYVNMCKQKIPTASIFLQDSATFLTTVLPFVNDPCLFWLDAHLGHIFYGSPITDKDINFPLVTELDIIRKKENVKKDVIIIDDTRIIRSTDNETYEEGLDERYYMDNLTIQQIRDWFPNHDVKLIKFQQGLCVLFPKQPN